MEEKLLFVYNADSGIVNFFSDWAHKVFAPATYSCSLCAITYSNVGMRRDWRQYTQRLPVPAVFLHRDELHDQFGHTDTPLPAVFWQNGRSLTQLIDAPALDACHSVSDLIDLVQEQIDSRSPVMGQ